MGKVIIDDNTLYNIANATREKLNVPTLLKPSEMPSAIRSIETGYPEPTGTINITANGTMNVKDYASANVNVPNSYDASDEGKVVDNGTLVSQTSESITQNGTYDTTLNNEVVVNVSGGTPTLVSKTITANGTYDPTDDNADGYDEVIVNVQGGGGGIEPIPITPVVNNASYINSGNTPTLIIGDSRTPNYRTIAIQLSLYSGKLIHIENTGNRNFYELYASNTNNATKVIFSGERKSTNGELWFYVDDFTSIQTPLWLVYDYTSSAQDAPTVTAYDIADIESGGIPSASGVSF